MQFLKLEKDQPVEAKILKYNGTVDKECQGNSYFKHSYDLIVDRETVNWEATELTFKQMATNKIVEGDDIIIEKVFKNDKNYINVYLAADARGQAALSTAKGNGTDHKTVSDARQKEIRFGLSMNVASRIVAANIENTSDKTADDVFKITARAVVSLAKAVYKEAYAEEAVVDKDDLSGLPF